MLDEGVLGQGFAHAPRVPRSDAAGQAICIERLTCASNVDVAPGFIAITRATRLREEMADILDRRGTIFVALSGQLVVGYTADVPLAPAAAAGGPGNRRWNEIPNAREGVIEVARGFRGSGVAKRLLAAAVAGGRVDREILIGEALVWHWDLAGVGISPYEYRARFASLLSVAGFRRYDTDEPEIGRSALNFLVARIGPNCPTESQQAFEAALIKGTGT